jgi:hypothetical protein
VTEAIATKWLLMALPDAGLAIGIVGFFALGLLAFLNQDPYRELSRCRYHWASALSFWNRRYRHARLDHAVPHARVSSAVRQPRPSLRRP